MLIAQIGGGLFIPYHFGRRFHPNTSVVGGQDKVDLFVGHFAQGLVERRMLEPAFRHRSITDLIAGQFFQHFHFGTGMTEHINKIIDDYI